VQQEERSVRESKEIPAMKDPNEVIQSAANTVRAQFNGYVDRAVAYTRDEPEKAVFLALSAGYLLRGLPLVGILRLLIRLVFALLKPTAILYGGAKIWSEIEPDGRKPRMQKGANK
jgi:hypothetical protein